MHLSQLNLIKNNKYIKTNRKNIINMKKLIVVAGMNI